jgi:hypothetical protein
MMSSCETGIGCSSLAIVYSSPLRSIIKPNVAALHERVKAEVDGVTAQPLIEMNA